MSYPWNSDDFLPPPGCGGRSSRSHDGGRSIRLRRMSIGGIEREISIRLVETFEKITTASELLNKRYSWRGYGSDHKIPFDPHHMTFTAEVEQEVAGTITLAIDSRKGLAVDSVFKSEIDKFRETGGRVCELTRFAFSPNIKSRELMASLFHIVFVYGQRTFGCTDLFIEVNPRHVRFYEAMLGFKRIGDTKLKESVEAPAQLMWLEVAAIRGYIDGHHRDSSDRRSLYPLFFSPAAETGIYNRLVSAGAAETQGSFLNQLDIAGSPAFAAVGGSNGQKDGHRGSDRFTAIVGAAD